jgi:hypothetical protein
VPVNAGRFQVELQDVPDACLVGGELYADIAVGPVDGTLTDLSTGVGSGRVLVGAVPFAAASPRAATLLVESDADIGGNLDVVGGVTTGAAVGVTGDVSASGAINAGTGVNLAKVGNTSRVGFAAQSNDPGEMIHYENNNTGELWLSSSDDWDTNATNDRIVFGEYSSGTEKHAFDAAGNARHEGSLSVGGHVFGTYEGRSVNANHVAASDGLVIAHLAGAVNGARGYLNGLVNGTLVARESSHYYTTSDTHVNDASMTFPVRRGDTYRVDYSCTSGICTVGVNFVAVAP